MQYLSDYERKEILDYSYVYFIGANSEKKMASRDTSTNNYGYDDDVIIPLVSITLIDACDINHLVGMVKGSYFMFELSKE